MLVIAPPGEREVSADDADALLREALREHKPSQAAAEVARATGLDRKALYARAMELKLPQGPGARLMVGAANLSRRGICACPAGASLPSV